MPNKTAQFIVIDDPWRPEDPGEIARRWLAEEHAAANLRASIDAVCLHRSYSLDEIRQGAAFFDRWLAEPAEPEHPLFRYLCVPFDWTAWLNRHHVIVPPRLPQCLEWPCSPGNWYWLGDKTLARA